MPNRVTGLKFTKDRLRLYGVHVEAIIAPTLETIGRVVAADMAAHIHSTNGDSVHLAEDIKVGPVERRGPVASLRVGPSKRTNWRSRFLEFGTRLMTARPFMRPARSRARKAVKERIRDNAA